MPRAMTTTTTPTRCTPGGIPLKSAPVLPLSPFPCFEGACMAVRSALMIQRYSRRLLDGVALPHAGRRSTPACRTRSTAQLECLSGHPLPHRKHVHCGIVTCRTHAVRYVDCWPVGVRVQRRYQGATACARSLPVRGQAACAGGMHRIQRIALLGCGVSAGAFFLFLGTSMWGSMWSSTSATWQVLPSGRFSSILWKQRLWSREGVCTMVCIALTGCA